MRKKWGRINKVNSDKTLLKIKIIIFITMKELEKIELVDINGGSPATANYIGGLSPAIPESGGDFIMGFFKGLFKSVFGQ